MLSSIRQTAIRIGRKKSIVDNRYDVILHNDNARVHMLLLLTRQKLMGFGWKIKHNPSCSVSLY